MRMLRRGSSPVAAGFQPAVEGGILPPGRRGGISSAKSAGQDARLYGNQHGCRYARAAVVVLNGTRAWKMSAAELLANGCNFDRKNPRAKKLGRFAPRHPGPRLQRRIMKPRFPESQRDSVTQPKVAESARLPWVGCRNDFQAQRGCVIRRVPICHNPIGVGDDFDSCSQRSSFLATAGLNYIVPLGQTNWSEQRRDRGRAGRVASGDGCAEAPASREQAVPAPTVGRLAASRSGTERLRANCETLVNHEIDTSPRPSPRSRRRGNRKQESARGDGNEIRGDAAMSAHAFPEWCSFRECGSYSTNGALCLGGRAYVHECRWRSGSLSVNSA